MKGVMLNAYPDSLGGNMECIATWLEDPRLKDVFSGFYVLPSLYHTDLDRGFSVQDYDLEESLVKMADLERIKQQGIALKLDFILNHASVLSPQFQDLLRNGQASKYKDFFINWNEFWKDEGVMSLEGYIIPKEEHLHQMFFRKPGLPLLMVRMPDGQEVPYWNTFYQQVNYHEIPEGVFEDEDEVRKVNQLILNKDIKAIPQPYLDYVESHRTYLGQMDLNIQSPLVWQFYDDVLKTLKGYGAEIVRLDAFAYAPKAVGRRNFLNEPDTWDTLKKVQDLADQYQLTLLPEIHDSYVTKKYELLASKGFIGYDFFLPGLILHTLETKKADAYLNWVNEIIEKQIKTINMLGCHDGIPLLDLKGILSDEEIQSLIDLLVRRGGYVKNLEGAKNMYYQVNATYYSALGEDDQKLLAARALQIFTPGICQVWYLDLFAGKNNYEALTIGHKEINRTNLSVEEMYASLNNDVVAKQLDLLRLRNTHPAFDGQYLHEVNGHILTITARNKGHEVKLILDLDTYQFTIQR